MMRRMMRLATPGRTDYVAPRMLPVINREETIEKPL